MTDTLVAFLNARLDEDEQAAKAAIDSHQRKLRITPCLNGDTWSHEYDEDDYGGTQVQCRAGHAIVSMSHDSGSAQRIHIARHDPARALREVDAKRRIIAEHPLQSATLPPPGAPLYGCETCHDHSERGIGAYGECDTLKLLALPHADHPDFNEEWRP